MTSLTSSSILTCIIVAFIWGSTNNLIKHYTPKEKDEDKEDRDSKKEDTNSLKFLYYLKNYKFTLSFLANQLGSVYFTYSLGDKEIGSFIPVTNGLRVVVF